MKLFLAVLAAAALPAMVCAQMQAARPIDFAKEVHPLLQSRCASCHTGDSAQAGLHLDSRDGLLHGGKDGPAIVPGKPSESLLILKVTGQHGLPMPPSGPRLTPDAVAILRAWIEQGAKWELTATAASQPASMAPRNPPIPAGDSPNPIDRFIEAYWKSKNVAIPAPVSDAVFARRAYLDIQGLLPSPEELQAFLNDDSANKRAVLVNRLLSNHQAYAENWISFWNDLLRNDEGVVYHGERKTITEWLLKALKSNMPYDRMVQALLNPVNKKDPEGFLIGVNWRGVVSASQSPPMQASQNSAQVFLGMNLKCAACHDSFVNRWKLRDTYGLAAMFSDDELQLVRCDVPTGKVAEPGFPLHDIKVSFDKSLESRRAAAANWFTCRDNGRFARTLVNRYWKVLFGRAIVEPVDDMDAEPWSRDLLDWLAWDFAGQGYDLQHLLSQIMTSRAYQAPSSTVGETAKDYVFRGPRPRRLTAEQFEDAISCVSGDWRVLTPRTETFASYTREWRLKSDPLSRALGRPIRDQVYTERNTQASTLQALELTNGPLLAERVDRAAKALLHELPPAPANRFDSKLMRRGAAAVDVDITGAKDLWLVTKDVDSYDPAHVIAGWGNAELSGPQGVVRLADLPGPSAPTHEFKMPAGTVSGITAPVPSVLHWSLDGKAFTRLRAKALIDPESEKSEINPAVRFFVFTEKPEMDRLIRIEGQPPVARPRTEWTPETLVDRLYSHLLSRSPTSEEKTLATRMLAGDGSRVSTEGLEDLLWAMLMSPEFQFIL
jgi:mono/diheme cytochrome c family protein